ncbi:MAG: tetratricopeptide repeat protein [Planctomycetota bacterium]
MHRIFAAVCELDPAARTSQLDRLCSDDAALRAEVEALLRHDVGDDYLGEDGLARVRASVVCAADEELPERIGAYRILGELGRGGMGVVYRAAQEQPAREVALKVLAPGLGAEAMARFGFEAAALGRLSHPGIAQIHEAGSYESANGPRPYLAMELVDGETIRAWAERAPRTVAQRLELVIQLCDAVHHAHQKGLIHRDLKPGNVLVDGAGRVRVLDFGIARLVAVQREQTLMTHTGQLLGTLAYMSPEQADGASARVDTRADVYAIGVIAYELLAGRLPIDVRDEPLTTSLQRIVHESPPPLGQLDRRLRGDLETVVEKALRKEPERRYASAHALAADLHRVLRSEPIEARPPTATYLVSRFARRHRGLVAGLLVAALALVGGSAASVAWALHAEAAEQAAVQARQAAEDESYVAQRIYHLVQQLFAAAAPRVAQGQEVSARDVVQAGVREVDAELLDEPLLHARVSRFLGATLLAMGDYEQASAMLERALQELRSVRANVEPHVLADTLAARAHAHLWTGDLDAAERLVDEGLEVLRASGQEQTSLAAALLVTRGGALRERRSVAAAEAAYLAARAIHERLGEQGAVAECTEQLANVYQLAGDIGKAEAAFERALALLPDDRPVERAAWSTNLGNLRVAQRRFDDAERLFRTALEVGERDLGPTHPLLIRRLCNLAGVLGQTGRLDEATPLLERAVAMGESVDSRFDDGVANACTNLGNVRAMQGNLDEALRHWQRAVVILERRLGPDARDVADVLENIAIVHQQQGRADQAAALRQRVARIRAAAK